MYATRISLHAFQNTMSSFCEAVRDRAMINLGGAATNAPPPSNWRRPRSGGEYWIVLGVVIERKLAQVP